MTPAARRRAAAAARARRRRQRERDHQVAVTVIVDDCGIGWLVEKVHVLRDSMKHSRAEIGAAITRMIEISSRNFP